MAAGQASPVAIRTAISPPFLGNVKASPRTTQAIRIITLTVPPSRLRVHDVTYSVEGEHSERNDELSTRQYGSGIESVVPFGGCAGE